MDKPQKVLYNLLAVTEKLHFVSGEPDSWQLDQAMRSSQSYASIWLSENAPVCPIVIASLLIGGLETWGRDDIDKSCISSLAKIHPQTGLSIAVALTHTTWITRPDGISTNFEMYHLRRISPKLYSARTSELFTVEPADWDRGDFEEFRLCYDETDSEDNTPEELLPAEVDPGFCLSTGRLIHEKFFKNPGKHSLAFLTSLCSECPLLSISLCAWAYWNLLHWQSSPYYASKEQLEEILASEFAEFLFFCKIKYIRPKCEQDAEDLFAKLRNESPEEFDTLLQRCRT